MRLNYIETGDCIELMKQLPDACVDAVITDPPYSSGGMMRSDRTMPPSSKYLQTQTQREYIEFSGDNRDARGWVAWCYIWMSEAMRILKPSGYLLCFSDWRMLPCATDAIQAAGIVWRGIATWDKGLGARAPHKGYFRHQAEFIAWGTKGKSIPAIHSGPWPGVIQEMVKQSDKHHMTGKPTPLMQQLVQCCPPGGIILDPFCGSGTTCVAAKMEVRNFIGYELNPGYAEIARKRIEAVDAPLYAV